MPEQTPIFDPQNGLLAKAKSTTASIGKLALIGGLILLLLIPTLMIQGLVREREGRRGEAEREVAGKWGSSQTFAGPILTVPFRVHSVDANGKVDTATSYANFLPDELDILSVLIPEVRKRGIFEVPLYQADLEISGHFKRPSLAAWKVKPEDILWDEAYLTLSVPDLRSVAEAVPVEWLGTGRPLAPENLPGRPVYGGLQAMAPLGAVAAENGYPFKTRIKLNGSRSLRFIPMGRTTRVTARSPWSNPSFDGAYLPDSRAVNASGFQADWTTYHLSRSFPQQWTYSEITDKDWLPFGFGVDLILPVDGYAKAERCAKYAVLFILLTFLVFFLYETFDRTRIHPLQYLLVGFALCLFYLLLLSLSEHIGFGPAYGVAAAAVVGLITSYGLAILAARKRAWGLGAMLTGLYGYLYTLLQMEDYALLGGSLGLFAILGTVMFLTRKVNWYGGKPGAPAAAPGVAGVAA
jgi:inner membrane protein